MPFTYVEKARAYLRVQPWGGQTVTLARMSQVVTGGHGWSRVGHGCYVGLASPSFLQVTGGSRVGHGSIPGESCHDRSLEHANQCLPATKLVHRHHLRRRLRVLTTKCMKSTCRTAAMQICTCLASKRKLASNLSRHHCRVGVS